MFVGCSSDLARNKAYKAKIRAYSGTGAHGDYTPPVVQFKLDEMWRKFACACMVQTAISIRVGVLIGKAGVSVIARAGYQAFSATLYRLARTQVGESLAMEAANVIALWVARGLNEGTLEGIRNQVFSIPEPIAP